MSARLLGCARPEFPGKLEVHALSMMPPESLIVEPRAGTHVGIKVDAGEDDSVLVVHFLFFQAE